MGGGSSGSGGQQDYYGHAAGVVCQGQLDFIWGIMINNDLVWPTAVAWDAQIYPGGNTVIYTDGNVYTTLVQAEIDPPDFPWQLVATPYTAGTYAAGFTTLYMGNLWMTTATTSAVPPETAPAGNGILGVQKQPSTNGWIFVSTPGNWADLLSFWPATSIVAWRGRLWINSADTKAEPPNAPWSLWKIDRAANANPLKLTVEGSGDAYLYWGTANQNLDTVNENILSSLGNPPYRNKALLVLHNFLFGTGISTPPDVIVLGGRTPVQNLIVGASAVMDADWQVNPWCVLAELLTHPVIGLGLPVTFFDAASWQAEADRCAANPSLYYISPIYDSLKKIREIVSDLMGYPDAFVFWTTLATLAAGHWPHGEAPPVFDETNTINRDDLVEEFDWDATGWGATSNSVQLSFDDIESGFKSRPVFAPNLFNQRVVKRLQSTSLDRPFIVRADQALAWAAEFAKLDGEQAFNGTVKIRAERASNVRPGSLFLLTDDVLQLSQVNRCTRRVVSAPPKGVVELTHETERGIAAQSFSPSQSSATPDSGPPPTRPSSYAVIQLTSQLGASGSISLLAGRTNAVTTGLDVYFRQADNAAFQLLGRNLAFAVPGAFDVDEGTEENIGGSLNTVVTNLGAVTAGNTYNLSDTDFWKDAVTYADDAAFTVNATVAVEGTDYVVDPVLGTIQIIDGGAITTGKYVECKTWQALAVNYDSTCPQSDMDSVMESLTQDEINDGEILLFAIQNANPAQYEIMSIRAVQAVGNGSQGLPTWFVKVIRAQFGTIIGGDGSHVWGSDRNDVIFMMKRSWLLALDHESFADFESEGITMDVRIVPSSAWVVADLNDIYNPATNPAGLTTEFNYVWDNINFPTATFGQTNLNGAPIADFTVDFSTTDVFNFVFNISDMNNDLVQATLVAVQGQQEITLWSTNVAKTGSLNNNVSFSLPAGTWNIRILATDAAGNQSTTDLVDGGGFDILINVVAPSAGSAAASPVLFFGVGPSQFTVDIGSYVSNVSFGPLPRSTAGYQVKYSIVPRNAAPAGYTNCTPTNLTTPANTANWIGPMTVKKGSSGQTLYAYATQTGKTDSPIVMWNF